MSSSTARAMIQSDRHRTLSVGFFVRKSFPSISKHLYPSGGLRHPSSLFPSLCIPRGTPRVQVLRDALRCAIGKQAKKFGKADSHEASGGCASKKRSVVYESLSMICFWTKFFCFEVVSLQFYTVVYIHVFMSWGHAILFGVHAYYTYTLRVSTSKENEEGGTWRLERLCAGLW